MLFKQIMSIFPKLNVDVGMVVCTLTGGQFAKRAVEARTLRLRMECVQLVGRSFRRRR